MSGSGTKSGNPSSSTSTKDDPPPDVKPSPKLLDQLVKRKGFPHHGPGSHSRMGYMNGQDPYIHKLRNLKRAIKDAIFVNGTICDEVLRTEEKLAKAKEERRFLLRKLLQYQNISETSLGIGKAETPSVPKQKGSASAATAQDGTTQESTPMPKQTKAVKRKQPPGGGSASAASGSGSAAQASGGAGDTKKKAQSAKDILDSLQTRPKKSKGVNRKTIPPLMLDSLGRPVFPMGLGDITLHSIGEIIPDRPNFHCAESIYPVGYCITRVYTSLHKLDSKCLYTCKISDNNDGPLFEIAAEDNSEVIFKGLTPSDCHILLLRAVNKSRGDVLPLEGKGLDFFGLSHPVIQNLVQSCPGARKCSSYKWVKFEFNRSETNDNVAVGLTDPTVSYDAFKAHIGLAGKGASGPSLLEQSTNLRSLLTKGNAHPS